MMFQGKRTGRWLVAAMGVVLLAAGLVSGPSGTSFAAKEKKFPAHTVKSWGKIRGEVRAGHQVRAGGFMWGAGARKVKGEKRTYRWFLGGKRVKTGRFYRLPKSSKGKTVKLKVVISARGYKPRARTFTKKIGKAKMVCPSGQVLVGPDDSGDYVCWSVVQQPN